MPGHRVFGRPTQAPLRSRTPALLVPVLLLTALLVSTGCAQGSAAFSAGTETRAPLERDGGVEVTVPALWADPKTSSSGIEPAKVWATKDGAARFTIELEGIAAKGAGPQWTAASAAAAAVGSMVSGLNPGRVDVNFAITGPIDGPSAGGILTVGVLAALLNAPLRGDMTMTGTISPDGSIGPIGGVELKLKAAAEQGYTRVLLPLANMTVRDSSSDATVSAVEAGKKLGLDVQGVGNVQEAFTLFTDGRFAYPAAPEFALPAPVNAVTQGQSSALLYRLTRELETMPGAVDTSSADSLLEQATLSEQSGDTAASYGIATQGLYLAGRERAAADMGALIAEQGLPGASRALTNEIERLRALNQQLLSEATSNAGTLGYEQQISAPNVLGWLTYDSAILDALTSKLTTVAFDESAAQRYARILADARLELEVLYPDQLQVLLTSPSMPSPGDSSMAAYLSEYTSFLVGAGKAQQDYVQKVVLRGQDPVTISATNDVGLLLPVILNLADAVDRFPAGVGSLADELKESSTAITYYIATTSLIASVQGFGLDQFGIGADPNVAGSPLVLDSAVATSTQAVTQVSGLLAERGLDPSLPFWGASTGAGAARVLTGGGQETAADVRALNELYFDTINVFMLQAGPAVG